MTPLDAILSEVNEISGLFINHIVTSGNVSGECVGTRIHGTYWDAATGTTVPAASLLLLDVDGIEQWAPMVGAKIEAGERQ